MKDPYLYEDCDVLKNKLDIKDKERLERFEADAAICRIATIDDVDGDYGFDHLKAVHKHIFGDVYDWAGEPRTVPIYKEEKVLDGLSVEYTAPSDIEKEAETVLGVMNKIDWEKLTLDERAKELSRDISRLWQAHVFREGNTRTTMTFACEFANAHGMPMDKTVFKEYAAFTRNALVMSAIGEYSEPEHLEKIIKDSMERGEREKGKAKTENNYLDR